MLIHLLTCKMKTLIYTQYTYTKYMIIFVLFFSPFSLSSALLTTFHFRQRTSQREREQKNGNAIDLFYFISISSWTHFLSSPRSQWWDWRLWLLIYCRRNKKRVAWIYFLRLKLFSYFSYIFVSSKSRVRDCVTIYVHIWWWSNVCVRVCSCHHVSRMCVVYRICLWHSNKCIQVFQPINNFVLCAFELIIWTISIH